MRAANQGDTVGTTVYTPQMFLQELKLFKMCKFSV